MNPILLNLPESFDTERLTIRCPRPGDGAEVNAAIRESWPELQQWMPFAKDEPPTVEWHEAFVRGRQAKYLERSDMMLLAFLKGTHSLVMATGLHPRDWDVPSFEIGYWCRTPCVGRGYVSEAVQAITAFGFEHLKARRIQIRADARNQRSRAVAERCGYALEGILRNDAVDNQNQLSDTAYYALVR
jgi:RimJ/RimL family protein N-acetyltransferase